MHLDVRVHASPFGIPRIGIVVPRHHHSAVDRNRLKRRLRELARLELLPAMRAQGHVVPVDIAIRARREAYDASFEALGRDVATIVGRVAASRTADPGDAGDLGQPGETTA